MNKTVQPIETHYKGYRFRSRLEARWAVFLDALGIKWEYEAEGYKLSDGTWYLPDFWLPTFDGGMYVEVKPDGGDFSTALRFAKEAHVRMWLVEGSPGPRAWLYYDEAFDVDGLWVGIPNADQADGEDRMYSSPGYENDDLSIDEEWIGCLGSTFLNAVERARSARFEHGETPQ